MNFSTSTERNNDRARSVVVMLLRNGIYNVASADYIRAMAGEVEARQDHRY